MINMDTSMVPRGKPKERRITLDLLNDLKPVGPPDHWFTALRFTLTSVG